MLVMRNSGYTFQCAPLYETEIAQLFFGRATMGIQLYQSRRAIWSTGRYGWYPETFLMRPEFRRIEYLGATLRHRDPAKSVLPTLAN